MVDTLLGKVDNEERHIVEILSQKYRVRPDVGGSDGPHCEQIEALVAD